MSEDFAGNVEETDKLMLCLKRERNAMKKVLSVAILGTAACLFIMNGFAAEQEKEGPGKAEFNEYCAACHPGGGNIFNTKKTLHKKDLEANKIKTPEDIVKIMRNPGPGMRKFDDNAIPDKTAKEIAEYIMKTFK
jgi:cytochrome c6